MNSHCAFMKPTIQVSHAKIAKKPSCPPALCGKCSVSADTNLGCKTYIINYINNRRHVEIQEKYRFRTGFKINEFSNKSNSL